MFWVETALSILMGTIGAYMLYRGKKTMEPKMMIWGGVLIVLSYFLFSGGSNNDDSKAMLKNLMTGSTGQPQQQDQPQSQPTPTPQELTPTPQP